MVCRVRATTDTGPRAGIPSTRTSGLLTTCSPSHARCMGEGCALFSMCAACVPPVHAP